MNLDQDCRDYLRKVGALNRNSLGEVTWPLVRGYLRSHHGQAIEESQQLLQIANMTKPHTWYPLSAGLQQRVIYHAGPTNSGKTYTSIQVHFLTRNRNAFLL